MRSPRDVTIVVLAVFLLFGAVVDPERSAASFTATTLNPANVGFTYSFSASQANNTLLWSDATNGLQVTASRGATTLYSGALKNMLGVAVTATVAAGGTDVLTYVFSLPTSAGNTFQTLTQDLTITYTATQLPGTAR